MAEQGHKGLGTVVEIGDGEAQTGVAITAIAVANGVATVTATAHGLSTGDVVTIAGVVGTGGMPESVNRDHLVRQVDANDVVLGSFVEGAYTSGGTIANQNTVYAIIPGVRDGSFESQADEIDITNILAPDGYRAYDSGLKANTFTLNMNFLPEEQEQGMITGLGLLFNSGAKRWVRNTYNQITPVQYGAALVNLLQYTDNFDMEGRLELVSGGRFSGPRLFIGA